ncbi:MAG: adenylate/guanylate cyclase domain-containing protein [Cyanobacteria bacterium P01_G01_bin.54]
MLHRFLPSAVLGLIGQGLSLLQGATPSPDMTYSQWEHRFMKQRLYLVLGLGLGIFLCMTTPRLVYDRIMGQALPTWWFVDLWVELGLLCSLGALRFAQGAIALNIIFLCTSGSVNVIEQLVEVALGGSEFDILDDFFNWVLVFFLQATLIPVRWRLHLLCHVLTYSSYFLIKIGFALVNEQAMLDWYPRDWTTPPSWLFTLAMISFVSTLSVYLHQRTTQAEFMARKAMYRAYQDLEVEQERSEELLRNILPDKIACQLKYESQTIAESFAAVTVLFADIVGFTRLSDQICATELVELLNSIFSRFDRLAERHSLEKIKTIGDAYMVVAGLPEPRADHAEAIAEMALDMQHALQDFNRTTQHTLQIRVGIHTGNVVAGVIGLKKFAYDIWGDTVNTASRMESHSLPGQIQVTTEVYQYLYRHYIFEARGEIEIKGKGKMTTYFLTGRAIDPLPAEVTAVQYPQY